jgi:Holliday junction resolvase RusA-like endonuclease
MGGFSSCRIAAPAETVQELAADEQNGTATAITAPVGLTVRVYFPDARKRDAGNLRKLVTDALQGAAVIADDCLIHDERWIRAGIDRQNPRAELTITPL